MEGEINEINISENGKEYVTLEVTPKLISALDWMGKEIVDGRVVDQPLPYEATMPYELRIMDDNGNMVHIIDDRKGNLVYIIEDEEGNALHTYTEGEYVKNKKPSKHPPT